eukprot:7322507-Pyramimonas_sp.AAC.1
MTTVLEAAYASSLGKRVYTSSRKTTGPVGAPGTCCRQVSACMALILFTHGDMSYIPHTHTSE